MIKKSIDINQRIPLDTIEVTLRSFLNDNYSNEYILEQLGLEFSGDNRLKKALRIVNKIVDKNPMRDWLYQQKKMLITALKRKEDRNIILIALLNATYPFSFDLLSILGKYFGVQEIVSRGAFRKNISGIYGSNRATENAIDSVIPMFLEASLFQRPRPGFYQFAKPMEIHHPITKELYAKSYIVNKGIKRDSDIQWMEPYFLFISK
jgi:hypothetical protein